MLPLDLLPATNPFTFAESVLDFSAAAHTNMVSTVQNQHASPLLRVPSEVRTKILNFALGGHHIRAYRFNNILRLRVCPVCYYGVPYAMALGAPVLPFVLLALTRVCRQIYLETWGMVMRRNEWMGYPVPLGELLRRLTAYHAGQVTNITVDVMSSFKTRGKEVLGLADDVVAVLRTVSGMRGLERVRVEWKGQHDNHGVAHEYLKKKILEMFVLGGGLRVEVPMLGTPPEVED